MGMRISKKIKSAILVSMLVATALLAVMVFSVRDGSGKISGILERFQHHTLEKGREIDEIQSQIMRNHVSILALELRLHSFKDNIDDEIKDKTGIIISDNNIIEEELLDFFDIYLLDDKETELIVKAFDDFKQYRNYIEWAIKSIPSDAKKSRDYLLASGSYFFRMDNSFKRYYQYMKMKSQKDLSEMDRLVYINFRMTTDLVIIAFILVVFLAIIILFLIKDKVIAIENNEKRLENLVAERTQELMVANHAKTDFLSRMSHELNTPLNAIICFSNLLHEHLDPIQQRMTNQIVSAGDNLRNFLDNVFEYSQIELNQVDIEIDNLPIKYLMEECKARFVKDLKEKQVTIVDYAGYYDFTLVNVDKRYFNKVLSSLISNAIKYNVENGFVKLSYQVIDGKMLRIFVSDTGIGVNPALTHQLFQPFERLDRKNSEILGAGLSLVIAKRLAKRMGGDIGYQEVSGCPGATFWMDVALAES